MPYGVPVEGPHRRITAVQRGNWPAGRHGQSATWWRRGAALVAAGRAVAQRAPWPGRARIRRLAVSGDTAEAVQPNGLQVRLPRMSPERASLCRRPCLRFTIRHHVTNETDSQNAGALPPPESLNAIGDARIDCFEHFWQPSGREAAHFATRQWHLRARCNSAAAEPSPCLAVYWATSAQGSSRYARDWSRRRRTPVQIRPP